MTSACIAPHLTTVLAFIEALNSSGVRYCHWKSNAALAEALSGLTDIDLLVHRRDADSFRALLTRFHFRPAGNPDGSSFPSTEHYFALDNKTGVLVHVHAYFRVITGESLAKNFRLPLEDMLLENTRTLGCVRVPTKAAELVVFTIRMMLKHTTLVELALLAREWGSVKREAASLADPASIDESAALVRQWLPTLDAHFFVRCVLALLAPAPLLNRLLLARRLRSSVSIYARQSRLRASWTGLSNCALMLLRRAAHTPKGLVLRSGGAVIAFVGPEATGKSTLIGQVSRWLGEHFVVSGIHAGKPRSTMLTLLPNTLVPLLRIAMPGKRPCELAARHSGSELGKPASWVYPLSFAIRSVLLAYDRRALLTRAFARASNGTIVLCDRYPYLARGCPDGPQLMHFSLPRDRYPLRNILSQLERQLYEQIPRPDLIIGLTTPVEVAIARNRTRGKHEPEDYVRRRHSAAQQLPADQVRACTVNTNRDLDETLNDVKKAIWKIL